MYTALSSLPQNHTLVAKTPMLIRNYIHAYIHTHTDISGFFRTFGVYSNSIKFLRSCALFSTCKSHIDLQVVLWSSLIHPWFIMKTIGFGSTDGEQLKFTTIDGTHTNTHTESLSESRAQLPDTHTYHRGWTVTLRASEYSWDYLTFDTTHVLWIWMLNNADLLH